MECLRSWQRRLTAAGVVGGWLALLPCLFANGLHEGPAVLATPQLRQLAEQLEATGQWAAATWRWEQLLRRDRQQTDVKQHYLLCLRHAQQVRRYRDSSYRSQGTNLKLTECVLLYSEALTKLQAFYPDRDKADLGLLCRQGLEELRLALEEPTFVREFLPGVRPAERLAFRDRLQNEWMHRPTKKPADVPIWFRDLAVAAQSEVHLSPGLIVLELICGACNGLDEYTEYLTPGQFAELDSSWKGEFIGVGLDLRQEEDRLLVSQVLPGSSAHQAGLKPGDRILRIGGKAGTELTPDLAVDLLKGDPETLVELEVASDGQQPHSVKLRRQVIQMVSVSDARFLDERLGIGYVRVYGFLETTLEELDLAISKLQSAGMKTLVLDLRGNRGGLFEVAIQVAERFLSNGIIVSTHGQIREYNSTYQAHSMNPLQVPMVILVDADTASSAEMLAGALKENQRGMLVGQTTFGKGTLQKIQRLTTVPAGIRMTVARFYSPRGHAFQGLGVAPDLVIPAAEMPVDLDQDPQVQQALAVARPLSMGR